MTNDGTPRARRWARESRTRLGGFACALLLLLALPGAARSEMIGLNDLGAFAQIDTAGFDEGAPSVLWGFESGAQVSQFFFLSGVELAPMHLELADMQVTDTNSFVDPNLDTAALTYEDGPFGMQISLLLRGVPEPAQMSDLAETIYVWNDSEETTVYLNQIVVTSLWDDLDGDGFAYPSEPGSTNLVRIVDGLAVFEEVVTPEGAFSFFGEFGDSSFLMRWEIEPGEFLLSKDKSVHLVPEPGTAALLGLGLLGLAILGRRRP